MKNSRRALLVCVGAVVLGGFAGMASASNLTVPSGVLDAGSAAVAAPVCGSGQLVVNSVRSTYSASTYRLTMVNLSTLNANCRSDAYQLTIANNDTGFPSLGEATGTTPTATGLMTFGSIDVNTVNSTNNQVRAYMLVKG